LLKKFKRHILSFVPTAKIESVRFRSIAFQKPTAKLPSETDPTPSSSKLPGRPTKEKEPLRQHEIDRVSSWRSSTDASTEDPGKKYLTPREKKRVAFIKQDFHEHGDAVNAYIVFAYPPPPEMAKRLETEDIMDPYEAAKITVKECDGTIFEGKTIRVDGVRKCGAGDASGEVLGDPKLSIFVGNLDFAAKEEDLRAFFETLVDSERGVRPQDQGEANGDEIRSSGWVARVRVVKDKDTLLGKGFAYVQFAVRNFDVIFLIVHPVG
jgi:nucleolar protein 12